MTMVTADLAQHMYAPSSDPQPTNIATQDVGAAGYPGVLGTKVPHAAQAHVASAPNDMVRSGNPNPNDDYAGVSSLSMLRTNAAGLIPNPDYSGLPGRGNRLAADLIGPAHTGQVESFAMNGSRIKPGRPDLAKGGPVGASNDLGQYLAVAMAHSSTDFPAQALAQLEVLAAL